MKTPDDIAIHASLADATFRAYREAVIRLPPDVLKVIRRAAEAETSPVARGEFANILKNIEVADELGVPLCQDTGIPVVYLTIPPDVPLTQSLYDAVADGCPAGNKGSPAPPQCRGPPEPAEHEGQYRCRDPGHSCETRGYVHRHRPPQGCGCREQFPYRNAPPLARVRHRRVRGRDDAPRGGKALPAGLPRRRVSGARSTLPLRLPRRRSSCRSIP